MDHAPSTGIRSLLRATLTERMRARDKDAVAAVRSALAAIDNAEAVPVSSDAAAPGRSTGGSADVATPHVGVGAADVARRDLSEDDMRAVVAAEAQERADLSRRLGDAGASDAARVAFEQATTLRFLLDVAAS